MSSVNDHTLTADNYTLVL